MIFTPSFSEQLPIITFYRDSLVFCGSKKSTETLAELLSQRIRLQYTFSPQDVDLIRGIQDAKLRELVYRGVAFHHAGLPPSDKVILEQLYCLRKILILTCTSTLAFGVNLPAHLVIVKGTSHYRGIFSTLSLQMVIPSRKYHRWRRLCETTTVNGFANDWARRTSGSRYKWSCSCYD